MKKMKILFATFVAIMSGSVFAATITPKTPTQDKDKCYLIGSAAELYGFADIVNTNVDTTLNFCGKLTTDIIVNANVLTTTENKANVSDDGIYTGDTSRLVTWTPIGTSEHRFAGTIEGQGFSISGLYFNNDTTGVIGLVSYTRNNGQPSIISDLTIKDTYLRGSGDVAGFAGFLFGSLTLSNDHFSGVLNGGSSIAGFVAFSTNAIELKIEKSTSSGKIRGRDHIGGFVGGGYATLEIENSNSDCILYGENNIGGLVGHAYGPTTTVTKSFFVGSVTATSDWAGGLFGYGGDSLTIMDSYAEANITCGEMQAGGLIGQTYGKTYIINSHYKGKIDGKEFTGGLVGDINDSLWIENSYADFGEMGVLGHERNGGLVGYMRGDYLNVKGSYAKGNLFGSVGVGGILGAGSEMTIIEDSYYEGSIKAAEDGYGTGGLVGLTYGKVFIKRSYANAEIQGRYNVGGFIGFVNNGATIENSYHIGNVHGVKIVGGYVGTADNVLNLTNSYIDGSVSADSGIVYITVSNERNVTLQIDDAYYLKDVVSEEIAGIETFAEGVTAEDFASGMQAIKMHGYRSSDGLVDGLIWGQDLSCENPDKYPVFDLIIVFPINGELNDGSVKGGLPAGYRYGKTLSLPTPTREHYSFLGWYTDEHFAEGTEITEISGKKTGPVNVYAKWLANQYRIDVVVNDTTMGSVVGAGIYDYGSEITLKVIAKTGYQLSDWADDANASAERKITVTEAMTFTANFEAIPASSSSSSENVVKQSSSSAKVASSSSKKSVKDAIVASAQLPQFSVTVANRVIQVDGIVAGARVSLLDMQGRVLSESVASASSFSMNAPRAGTCFLRVDGVTRAIHVK